MAVENVHILLLASLSLIFAGLYFRDFPTTVFGGILTMITGLYITINGFGDLTTDLVRYGLGLIIFGFGVYVGIRGGYEGFKNY